MGEEGGNGARSGSREPKDDGRGRRMVALAFLIPPVLSLALNALPTLQLVHPRVVILASLAPYAWVTSLVILLVMVVWRPRLWLVLLVAAVITVAGLWVTRPHWPRSTPPAPEATVSLMTMNMRCNSPGDDQLVEMVRAAGPDVAVLNGLVSPGLVATEAWTASVEGQDHGRCS